MYTGLSTNRQIFQRLNLLSQINPSAGRDRYYEEKKKSDPVKLMRQAKQLFVLLAQTE